MKVSTILKIICIIGFIFDFILVAASVHKKRSTEEGRKLFAQQKKFFLWNAMVGVVANFFDTLGVGSFATSSALFKIRGSIDDINVPGTLNVGDTFPVLMEAFLFFSLVDLDPLTLVSMLVAATLGSALGANIVTKWNRTTVRYAMGVGLTVLGIIMACKVTNVGPFGTTGTATALHGSKLIIGIVCNFVLGALMNVGVGLYAPCMALVALLGMNVQAAFPIMMGSCAYLMAFGNTPVFVKQSRYDMIGVITQGIFGCIGVFIAYTFVKSLPIKILTILVVFVVFFTAILFLRDGIKDTKAKKAGTAA
ncbi:MAG: permease [Eubacterium sp.]|jgi:uncharacterized membrane protein YfcA|uniref:permease n=1 Tax=Eubacterium sp. F2 TaxID=3381348 RepID=UPI0039081A80|nr:permease [Eubacterium sp.]MCI2197832.1 permease [Eubacterium sp.]